METRFKGNKYFVFIIEKCGRDTLYASFDELYSASRCAQDLADELESYEKRSPGAEPDDRVYILDTVEVCLRPTWSARKAAWVAAEKLSYDKWYYDMYECSPGIEEYYADLPECVTDYTDDGIAGDPGYIPEYTDTRGFSR